MSEEKKDSSRPPVRNYLKQIDDFFEQTPLRNVIADLNHFFQKGNRLLTFPVDLYEVGEELVVTAELPGIQKEQIQIEIQNEYLKVSVKEEILEEEEQTSHNYYRRERSISEASRLIKLPYSINKKVAKASYQNGVLEIRAPKLPQQHDILSID
ncbi:Hsp20/alpha crystallin family protein [Bacillus cereus group sp. MYBK245-2]|uniref:18 kDa heat shock protein n=1 Tax=Bacillus pacificus TaxID=2026187 RepID=A0A1Y6AE06_9BACI|nr:MULTISPECIES: Hsp20/alpha crystallin family protein [Bacillus cereus group]PEB07606.1 Hsp20/alpha crystallin family protein [Bacillus cereus]MCU5067771.1 Hsp20/alpha crystallin family protein [Bacillus pacificus]MCZ7524189.1 Hsp20/alpha crystallin family protein [Bacillus pacificus]MDA1575621.1 Hsp20/alpha crystallin family protein [Bacillus cereus group sp. TH242-3LC]MED1586969.1 Hsp20/alpha crystallin family protein [Bacillus pacificus]